MGQTETLVDCYILGDINRQITILANGYISSLSPGYSICTEKIDRITYNAIYLYQIRIEWMSKSSDSFANFHHQLNL